MSRILFRQDHLSKVTGVALSDGRKVVLKERPWSTRYEACAEVQRAVYDGGFPCSRLLVGPVRIDETAVTIEEYSVAGSGQSESFAPSGNASGSAFFAHLCLTPSVDEISDVTPPLWLGWDHEEDGLWPQADDGPEDLNSIAAPDWLTAAAQHVREVLLGAADRIVVGHGDWEAQNVIWEGENLAIVHDWDSIAALAEPALVGAAAGVFGLNGCEPGWATLAGSQQFLAEYLRRREIASPEIKPELRAPWTDADTRVFWAAGLWVPLYNAQKAIARGQFEPYADRVRARVEERLPLTRRGVCQPPAATPNPREHSERLASCATQPYNGETAAESARAERDSR
ncbi:MAG: hypothetical protein QM705_00720 [Ancrocorticia sp.]